MSQPQQVQVQVVRGMRAPHEDSGSVYALLQQELLRPVQWQNPEVDKPFRQAMIGRIYELLRMRKPDAEQDWLKRLPDMAKRLEDSLYRSATSLNEYDDENTLKARLQQIAQDLKGVSNGASGVTPGSGSGSGARNQLQFPVIQAISIPAEYPPRPAPPPQPPLQPAAASSSSSIALQSHHSSQPASPMVPPTPHASHHLPHPPQPQPGAATMGSQPTPYASHGTPYNSHGDMFASDANGNHSLLVTQQQQQQQQQLGSPPATTASNAARPNQGDVLRQQQQRLLLLRHASKCPTAPGETCPATVHCQPMKVLWKHIALCKDPQCPTAHCVSSRFVLAHYHKCTDASCGVCEPVRLAIRKNGESKPPPAAAAAAAPAAAAAVGGGVYGTPAPTSGTPAATTAPPSSSADLIQRYIALWKQISTNAALAREKNGQLEKATEEANSQEKDLSALQEEIATYNMHEIKDEMWESHFSMLNRRLFVLQQNVNAARHQCKQLDAEVQKMRATHEKNVEAEKRLQMEFTTMFPGESGKNAIMQARNDAQHQQLQHQKLQPQLSLQQQQQHQHMLQQQLQQQHQHMLQQQQQHMLQQQQSLGTPKPLPIAQVNAQQVINQQVAKQKGKAGANAVASKEAKQKKPRKPTGAAAAAMSSSSTQPSPMMMGTPLSHHSHQQQLLLQQQLQQQQQYRPPSSPKSSLASSSSSSSHKRQPMTAAAVPEQAKRLEHIVPMFRECPTYSPTIFETSLINTFNRVDIQNHVQFLGEFTRETEMQTKANKFRELCHSLLKKCMELDRDHIFHQPVDPIQDSAPNYLEIIKHPMDFSTVRENIDRNHYRADLKLFLADMRLVYANCLLFNPPSTSFYLAGVQGGQLLEREFAKLAEHEEDRLAQAKYNVNNCSLCYGNKLLFEQIIYTCSGPCGKRIPKTGVFYSTPDSRHFCTTCLGEMENPIELQDGSTIDKRELKKDKHPEPQEEGFVSCYSCKRWMHQICAMLNTKRGQDSAKDDFLCPSCLLQVTDYHPKVAENYRKKATARDLPETEFSKFVESRLLAKVEKLRVEHLAKSTASAELSQEFQDAKTLSVRVVVARDAQVWTRTGMQKVYPEFPADFNAKQRVLLLFQKLGGVDVLLFIMFLQEYGSDCQMPNSRCVYLAYLDSVSYMRPAICRTSVYHQLIIDTMAFERQRGFTRFFIWACPPVMGDDYIFNIHPKHQKTPKPERLRLWYLTLLEAARQQGVVVSLSNFFDEYFSRMSELKYMPYFEGDCWTTYLEMYLTETEQRGGDFRSMAAKTDIINKALARKQTVERHYVANGGSGGGGGAISGGMMRHSNAGKRGRKRSVLDSSNPLPSLDVDADLQCQQDDVGGMVPALFCPPPRALETVPMQSALTWRISNEMEKMRDDFIVVKMHYDCVQCATPQDFPGAMYWLPKSYLPELDPHDYKKKRYAPPYCLCHECYQGLYVAEFGKPVECDLPEFPPPEWKDEYQEYLAEKQKSEQEQHTPAPQQTPMEEDESQPLSPVPTAPSSATTTTTKRSSSRKRKAVDDLDANSEERDSGVERGIEVLEFGTNAKPPNPYGSVPPCSLAEFRVEVAMIRPKTVDVDPPMECPIFNVREDFLDLCRRNKYQFDDLRRAKHSSAMVLFHLYNPETDNFVRTCDQCQAAIQGVRYTCDTPPCQDFDLCPKCYETVKHPHPLQMVGAVPSPAMSSASLNAAGSSSLAPTSSSSAAHLASHASSSSAATAAAAGTGGTTAATTAELEAQREQARQLTQNMLNAFGHASTCSGCQDQSCERAKKLLEHLSSCQLQSKGGCITCKRGWYLISYHSASCRMPPGQCKVRFCELVKERTRANANQNSDRRVMALMHRQTQQSQQGEEVTPPTSAVQSSNVLTPSSTTTSPSAGHHLGPVAAAAVSAATASAAQASSRQGVFGGKGKRPPAAASAPPPPSALPEQQPLSSPSPDRLT
ncbi:hypothetical protein BASA81_006114 [Batrachochytrium salamandrivorans]|nr:hypothetical protein BASA81_006114 [Batrachochytrium salamandrivorans]